MKKKFIYALALLMGVGVSGCSDFGDMNVNPAATTVGSPAALLANGISSMPGRTVDRRPGWYAQYFTETQYPGGSLYNNYTEAFSGNYSGALYDLQTVISMNAGQNMTNVAKIVQQFIFWHLTDRFGDIPYSEALQGQGNGSPKYDTQESIYKAMISTLTAAANSMDGSAISGDIVYNGDPAGWRRAANSLRMLMALQLSKRYPNANEYAATEFKAALADAGGYISTNAQNMIYRYDGAGYSNPIWGWYNGRNDDGESKTMTDILSSLNDGRTNPYGGNALLADQSSSLGVPYGLSEANVRIWINNNPSWAKVLRADLRAANSPVYMVTAAQVALARAEAAQRGWTTEVAATVYQQGITLSFQQWGLAAPAASYFTQDAVALNGTDNLRKIATQEWIAGYPNGQFGWNVWRRTGFPTLTPAPGATNVGGQIVRRYQYAASEYTNNKANVQPAADRIDGGDTNQGRVWWDVR